MKTLVIEHTAPFQGLPELVADAELQRAKENGDRRNTGLNSAESAE